MILIIDNFDSFVYNLVRYLEELKIETKIFRNNEITIEEIKEFNPDGILISPGPCTPNEAGISLDVISHFHEIIPILGVCLGHQALCQSFGGKIIKAKRPMHGKVTSITHTQEGIFKNIKTPLKVTRYHSLVVDLPSLPPCFQITAFSSDGEIMAVQHKTFPLYGVQFHPEAELTEMGHAFLQNFIYLTEERKSF